MCNSFAINQKFDDFDEFCAHAPAWNLRCTQLEAGAFTTRMLIAGRHDLQISRTRIRRRMAQSGAPPTHLRTFGVLARNDIEMFWRGAKVSGSQMFVFPRGGELDAVVEGNFDVYLFAVPEETVILTCELLGLPPFHKLLGGKEVFDCEPAALSRLRAYLAATTSGLALGQLLLDARSIQDIGAEACRHFVTALSTSAKETRRKRQRLRDIGLRRALDYLEDAQQFNSSIQELCDVACVSERTIEYAFLERFSVTPNAYMRIRRLSEVKKALLRADSPKQSIHEAALQYGFWHSGQFAADYRAFFGELPSHTLKRSPNFGQGA